MATKSTGKQAKVKQRSEDHRLLVLWAADCAEELLPLFERVSPDDSRPREAIQIARKWAADPVLYEHVSFNEIRAASLGSHAAARSVQNPVAVAAARGIGQAVATAHVPTHGPGVAWYADKAYAVIGQPSPTAGWISRLPARIRAVLFD